MRGAESSRDLLWWVGTDLPTVAQWPLRHVTLRVSLGNYMEVEYLTVPYFAVGNST